MDSNSDGVDRDVLELEAVSGLTPTPTPATHLSMTGAVEEHDAPHLTSVRPTSLEERPPTPTTARTLALIANLLGDKDVDAIEAALVGVREAWQRGDQSAIADALIVQGVLLETVGVNLLKIAGTERSLKVIQAYGNLALRAFEQSRKMLATVAGLKDKPRIQTNVQVNVASPQAGPANEKLVGDHGQ